MNLTSRTLLIRKNLLAFSLIYGFLTIDEAVAAFNHYETENTNADEIIDALNIPDHEESPAPWYDAANQRIVCAMLEPKKNDDDETKNAKLALLNTVSEQRKDSSIYYVDKTELENASKIYIAGISPAWTTLFDIFDAKKFLRKYSSDTIADIALDFSLIIQIYGTDISKIPALMEEFWACMDIDIRNEDLQNRLESLAASIYCTSHLWAAYGRTIRIYLEENKNLLSMTEKEIDDALNMFKNIENNFEQNAQNKQIISTKIPRNAPCPCGSGKKYKNCCAKSES